MVWSDLCLMVLREAVSGGLHAYGCGLAIGRLPVPRLDYPLQWQWWMWMTACLVLMAAFVHSFVTWHTPLWCSLSCVKLGPFGHGTHISH